MTNVLYENDCSNVEVNGVNRSNLIKIQNDINVFCSSNDRNSLVSLFNNIKEDVWIEKIKIARTLPDNIKIDIVEYIPFAIVNDGGTQKLINEMGHHINIKNQDMKIFNELLKIDGRDALPHIQSLFNLLTSNNFLFQKIKIISRIGKRRWDFELDNGILVKMPESNIISAWFNLEKILNVNGVNSTLKTIDLRNNEKTFLEWRN
jgi:cell division protein FtsQ